MKFNTAFFIARRYFINQRRQSIIISLANFFFSLLSFSSKRISGSYAMLVNPHSLNGSILVRSLLLIFSIFSFSFTKVKHNAKMLKAAFLNQFFFTITFINLFFSLFTFSKKRIKRNYGILVNYFINQNFIKILSNISMRGVGLGTAALIIILSVFNGLELLTMSLYQSYNPEIKVSPIIGKSFVIDDVTMNKLKSINEITAITEVIEDNALLKYRDKQMVVNMKGVSDNFKEQYNLNSGVVTGNIILKTRNQARAILGLGVQYQLSILISDSVHALQIWYPKVGKKISLNPDKAFNKKPIRASAAIGLEEKFDNSYVLVPLEFAEELMGYQSKRTSLEIKTKEDGNVDEVQQKIYEILGDKFNIKNAEEQQESVLRAVRIERLFVFIAFVFILIIASFNVFFSLAMLAIEKKKDIAVLMSMGANNAIIKRIFIYEGSLIALTGAFWGLVFGFIVCYIQQEYGVISLGVESSIVDAYPVKLKLQDFIYTGITIILITLLASFIPARSAAKTDIVRHI